MRTTSISIGLVVALAAGTMLAATPVLAQTKEKDGDATRSVNSQKVSLNLENADIRFALKTLFNAVGVNYTLAPEVQGRVTASLNDVPFRSALESILKSAEADRGLTYRVEDGVYNVTLRPVEVGGPDREPVEPDAPKKPVSRYAKVPLTFVDAIDLAQILGGTVIQSRFGSTGLGTGGGFGNGFGQGGFGQGGFGQGGFGQGGFGQGQFGGQGGFGQGQFGGGGGFNGGGFGSGNFGSGMGNGFGNGGGFRR